MNLNKILELKDLLMKLSHAVKKQIEIESFIEQAIEENKNWRVSITMEDPFAENYPVPLHNVRTYPDYLPGGLFYYLRQVSESIQKSFDKNNTLTVTFSSEYILRVLIAMSDMKKLEEMQFIKHLKQAGINIQS